MLLSHFYVFLFNWYNDTYDTETRHASMLRTRRKEASQFNPLKKIHIQTQDDQDDPAMQIPFLLSSLPSLPSKIRLLRRSAVQFERQFENRDANFKRFGEINRAGKALTSLTSASNYRHVAASRKKELAARGGWRGEGKRRPKANVLLHTDDVIKRKSADGANV